jgi:pimeloyl-ACP methyl ester carboxylesterase
VDLPETRYARSGDINIAYEVTGEGPFDLVFVPGYVTHLELHWKMPTFAPFLRRLSSFCRLIRFDKRGTGMSDPVSGAPTLETRMDDVRAVMDAVGSRRAAFYGLRGGGDEHLVRCDLSGANGGARHPQRLPAPNVGTGLPVGSDGRGVRARGRA